jgi:hypothetical protein
LESFRSSFPTGPSSESTPWISSGGSARSIA